MQQNNNRILAAVAKTEGYHYDEKQSQSYWFGVYRQSRNGRGDSTISNAFPSSLSKKLLGFGESEIMEEIHSMLERSGKVDEFEVWSPEHCQNGGFGNAKAILASFGWDVTGYKCFLNEEIPQQPDEYNWEVYCILYAKPVVDADGQYFLDRYTRNSISRGIAESKYGKKRSALMKSGKSKSVNQHSSQGNYMIGQEDRNRENAGKNSSGKSSCKIRKTNFTPYEEKIKKRMKKIDSLSWKKNTMTP
uniref:Phage_ABA_S domain-containing protein n=1 Tax=Rhabditophanes sp. KR3021 TaxID=114890 RepID=A0AC35UHD9_9BILA